MMWSTGRRHHLVGRHRAQLEPNTVASNGSLLVALGDATVATSSDDGATWTAQTTPADPFVPNDVVHDGTRLDRRRARGHHLYLP